MNTLLFLRGSSSTTTTTTSSNRPIFHLIIYTRECSTRANGNLHHHHRGRRRRRQSFTAYVDFLLSLPTTETRKRRPSFSLSLPSFLSALRPLPLFNLYVSIRICLRFNYFKRSTFFSGQPSTRRGESYERPIRNQNGGLHMFSCWYFIAPNVWIIIITVIYINTFHWFLFCKNILSTSSYVFEFASHHQTRLLTDLFCAISSSNRPLYVCPAFSPLSFIISFISSPLLCEILSLLYPIRYNCVT